MRAVPAIFWFEIITGANERRGGEKRRNVARKYDSAKRLSRREKQRHAKGLRQNLKTLEAKTSSRQWWKSKDIKSHGLGKMKYASIESPYPPRGKKVKCVITSTTPIQGRGDERKQKQKGDSPIQYDQNRRLMLSSFIAR